MTDSFMAPVADPPIPPLIDEIRELLFGLPAKELAAFAQLRDHQEQADADGAFVKVSRQALDEVIAFMADPDHARLQANAIMSKLMERGHYLPGAPCAQIILDDAKSFAERLTITMLALRMLNMLAWAKIETPESKAARRWLDDYLEGKNHGPAGSPMLWPLKLPGTCDLLRKWGFEPTPTMPPWVARSLPNPGMN